MTKLEVKSEGSTHAGHLRSENEDVFVIDSRLGLYGVFDGMGGHMAGDVAAEAARELVIDTVRDGDGKSAVDLLKDALERACKAIFEQAQSRRDRHGMGTTAVVAIVAGGKATVAHVGDSRAYLLRGTRLRQITADHTVVGSMLAAGAITPEEALHHPYKNVLSRCLGNQAKVVVDVQEVGLEAGDRLLLCSDGLSGYASHEAIEQVLRGAEAPSAAANDLIELALRGGGGDNVTAVTVFAGEAAVPQATVILRESGAHEWWRRRELFLSEARALGVAESPICANLSADEAVEIVAGNLCEAIFHDLEQTTGIHGWTYAENLASGWLERGGDYAALRGLMDLLGDACTSVVADIAASNASFAAVLEVEVTRALIVIESAVAGVIADRIRQLESKAFLTHEESFRPRVNTEQPTVPYLGGPRTTRPSTEVVACLELVMADTRSNIEAGLPSMLVRRCLELAHSLAVEPSSGVEVLEAARELYGDHEQGTMPLFEAVDEARTAHLKYAKVSSSKVVDKAEAMRRLSLAYQSVAHGLGVLVVDAGRPITDQLREMAEHTTRMRAQVRRGEVKVADFEARLSGATGDPGELMPEQPHLWERVSVLRDEVLNTAELGDLSSAGGEVFDAIIRWVLSQGETNPGLDLTLHEAINQRLAWGDPEGVVLANADSVCKRLLESAYRAIREPAERMAVAEAVAEVGGVVARIVASAALGRAGRERASILREEVLQIRLNDALERQKAEIVALERALRDQDDD